ncbi:DUF6542 domain-containing protein [Gandjariella thermophila]|uniref:DUF6542 domain-containing protein n=1 Tax=Gandjariella thermophila TaxID=1931992 RepID=A0A4D4J0G0_9PSEU|nr:DUF6542 domain-containing protein [Gandjariella thermophila]GDY29941.1 hypothetical protein GTS_15740 [Gandjariella thermophila]
MTATHDRRTDLDDVEPDVTPWTERPIAGTGRGLPLWGTVLLPLALSAVGAVVDIQRSKAPGFIFEALYLVSCVVAVCWARRRNVFGPTVQPPLILVIAVPLTVLVAGGSTAGGGGLTAKALSVATPLINSFPVMAITTALTVLIGLYRRIRQRNPYGSEERATRAAERRRERANRQREQAAKQRASTAARRGTPTRGAAASADAGRRGSSERSTGSARGGAGQRGQQARGGRQSPSARGGRPTPQPRRRRSDDR